jgi:hypothetical protein
MTPARLDFTIYRGITFNPLVFNVKDTTGTAVDLTGWQVFSQARNGQAKPIDLGPVITSAATGQITIDLTKEETAAFHSGEQQWDLIFQHPNGNLIGPYIGGTITVKDKVSVPT